MSFHLSFFLKLIYKCEYDPHQSPNTYDEVYGKLIFNKKGTEHYKIYRYMRS